MSVFTKKLIMQFVRLDYLTLSLYHKKYVVGARSAPFALYMWREYGLHWNRYVFKDEA